MSFLYKSIETPGGIYKVRTPLGRMGALQLAILTRATPTGDVEMDENNQPILSPGMKEALKVMMSEAFVEWSEQVLPHILVDGPHPYEEMPGLDQYALFMALSTEVNEQTSQGSNLFRIIESEDA